MGGEPLLGIGCRACSAFITSQDVIDVIERHLGMEFTDVHLERGDRDIESLQRVEDALSNWMRTGRRNPSALRFFPFDGLLEMSPELQLEFRDNLEDTYQGWIARLFESLGATWMVTGGDEVISH